MYKCATQEKINSGLQPGPKKMYLYLKHFYGAGASEIRICKPALVLVIGAEVDMYGTTRC